MQTTSQRELSIFLYSTQSVRLPVFYTFLIQARFKLIQGRALFLEAFNKRVASSRGSRVRFPLM